MCICPKSLQASVCPLKKKEKTQTLQLMVLTKNWKLHCFLALNPWRLWADVHSLCGAQIIFQRFSYRTGWYRGSSPICGQVNLWIGYPICRYTLYILNNNDEDNKMITKMIIHTCFWICTNFLYQKITDLLKL